MSKGEATSFKVLLIGNAEVGKTAIVNAWANSSFNPTYEPTLSPQLTQCVIGVDNDQIRLEVWDLGFAQLDSDKQLSTYANGAAAAVLVYDCNSESSAASVSYWHEKIQGRMTSDCLFVVVGCKADKLDYSGAAVQRARAFAASVGAQHTDVSARTGANVARLFETLARALAASGTPHASSTLEGDLDTTTHTVQTITDTIPEVPAVPTDTSMAISWPLGAASASSPMESAQLKLSRTWTRPCKLVLLGDPGVGKTCMAQSLAGIGKDAGLVKDYVPTAGPEMMAKLIDLDGASIKLQIWDAGGSDLLQEARLRSAVLQGFDVAVIIYDVASRSSFASISTWFRLIEEMHRGPDSVVMLLGSDGNLSGNQPSRVISESDGIDKAEALGVPFAELSTHSENQVTNLIHSFFAGCVQNKPAASEGSAPARQEQLLLGTAPGQVPATASQAQPRMHHRSKSPPQPQEPRQPEPLPRGEGRSSALKPTDSETRRGLRAPQGTGGYMGSTTASKLKESAEPTESEIRRGHTGSTKLKETVQPTESETRRGYMARTVASKSRGSAETTQIGQKDSSQVPRAMERVNPRSNHGTSVKPGAAGVAAAAIVPADRHPARGRQPVVAQASQQSQQQARQIQHPSNSKRTHQPLHQPVQMQQAQQAQQPHMHGAPAVPPLRQIQQLQRPELLQQQDQQHQRQQDQGPAVVPQWDQSSAQSTPQPWHTLPQRSLSPRPVQIASPRQEILQQHAQQQQAAQQLGSPSLQPSSPRQEIMQLYAQQQQAAQQLGSPSLQARNDPLSNSLVRLSWQPGMRSASPARALSPARSPSPGARTPGTPVGQSANPLRFPGLAAMEPPQAHMFLPPPQIPCVGAVDPSQARAASPPPNAQSPMLCGGQSRPEPGLCGQPMSGMQQRESLGRSSTFTMGFNPGGIPQGNRCASPSPPPMEIEPLSTDANRLQGKIQSLLEVESATARARSPVRPSMAQDPDRQAPQGKPLQQAASYQISRPTGNGWSN